MNSKRYCKQFKNHSETALFYDLAMRADQYEQAKISALEKVFLEIAETGKPTQAQLDFIKMMKPKADPLKEAEDMGKFIMSFIGFTEGR